jgi:hypothetical protein
MASLGLEPVSAASRATAPDSVADSPMAGASVASMAHTPPPSQAGAWSRTPPAAEVADSLSTAEATIARPTADHFTLAPVQNLTEPRSATIERLIHSLETRAERETQPDRIAAPGVERVTPPPTRRGMPRRLVVVVAGITIALLGLSGALAIVLGRG